MAVRLAPGELRQPDRRRRAPPRRRGLHCVDLVHSRVVSVNQGPLRNFGK
jgi:hypothetical protein